MFCSIWKSGNYVKQVIAVPGPPLFPLFSTVLLIVLEIGNVMLPLIGELVPIQLCGV
jgi:hypothetical protein